MFSTILLLLVVMMVMMVMIVMMVVMILMMRMAVAGLQRSCSLSPTFLLLPLVVVLRSQQRTKEDRQPSDSWIGFSNGSCQEFFGGI